MIRDDQIDNEYVFETLLQVARSEEFKAFSTEDKEFTRQCIRTKLGYLKTCYPDSYALSLDISDVMTEL